MTSAGDANGSGPKTPTSISKIAEKERKIGHRRVGVGGEITYKKVNVSVMWTVRSLCCLMSIAPTPRVRVNSPETYPCQLLVKR